MKTQNAETAIEEMPPDDPLGELILSYAEDKKEESFSALLEHVIDTEKKPELAIKLLEIHALNGIRRDIAYIREEGMGGYR
jgi:hypothetical protein